MISDKLPDFSGLPRVQKSSTVNLFLGFGLKRNSATNSLQMSSFYLNPTISISVKNSGQKVIQERNKQPLSIQMDTNIHSNGYRHKSRVFSRIYDYTHISLISLDFRLSQEKQHSQTLLLCHLGVAKSLWCLLRSYQSLLTTNS